MNNPALTPWQQRVYQQALENLQQGKMAHALLFCGEEGLGQRAVADALAYTLLSGALELERSASSQQKNQYLLAAGHHPDLQIISFLPNKTGDKLRTEIVIEQIRQLSQWLMLTPQNGIAQVVIIDPADALNTAASNALLKTLEEPIAGRYLWLVSNTPNRLPATIRSRCQRVELRIPPYQESLDWLQTQGFSLSLCESALAATRHHPVLAQQWLEHQGFKLQDQVRQDLKQLQMQKKSALEVAQSWSADEYTALRLSYAADCAIEIAKEAVTSTPAKVHGLAEWFMRVNQARQLLTSSIRADLLITDLLLTYTDTLRSHQNS